MGWDGMEISVSISSKSSEQHSAVLIKGAHYTMSPCLSNLNLAFEMYFLQILCYTFWTVRFGMVLNASPF